MTTGYLTPLIGLGGALLVMTAAVNPASVSTLTESLDDCEQTLRQLTSPYDWQEQLLNPVLTTEAEVVDRLALYRNVYPCLKDNTWFSPDTTVAIQTLIEYFLIFVAGDQTDARLTNLYFIDPATSDDPALVELRDEAAISPPRGFIFVRFYASREAMPGLARRAFENEDTEGATILFRYVAILAETQQLESSQALQAQTLQLTLSHELVHAYVNSVGDIQNIGVFPDWYDEGLAIYFSGSGGRHSVTLGDTTATSVSPEDYEQYDLNFKYLESQLGRPKLLSLIRLSLEQADPTLVYSELGIANEQVLAARAHGWELQGYYLRVGAGIGVALLIAMGLWRLISSPTAPAKEGPDPLRAIAPRCQICHKRFWPWKRHRLHWFEQRRMIWIAAEVFPDSLHYKSVHYICNMCLDRSQELDKRLATAIAEAETKASGLYEKWLKKAPLMPVHQVEQGQILAFEEALRKFTRAALRPKFERWLRDIPEFQLSTQGGECFDNVLLPPSDYQLVVQRSYVQPGWVINHIGSVFRLRDGRILIQWFAPMPNPLINMG